MHTEHLIFIWMKRTDWKCLHCVLALLVLRLQSWKSCQEFLLQNLLIKVTEIVVHAARKITVLKSLCLLKKVSIKFDWKLFNPLTVMQFWPRSEETDFYEFFCSVCANMWNNDIFVSELLNALSHCVSS